ncbi:hypothetical protein O0Q50_23025 [Priestia aryabhattai]|uniref:Lipoprotein n=1 Tax=Priestia aryabhattai TaxID=412384 RepID=A0AAX6NE13_PRIAR|nr:hypothetical protein [Priestia aryabhattai]MDU9694059.1 hypothetical protein [Priestia aryabhattai]
MKKTVLIGVSSLVLATSVLAGCGKESSTAASGGTSQTISMSQVSKVTVNGDQLSEKELKQYIKEYMEIKESNILDLNLDTQSAIKNIALRDALLKDLSMTQEQFDKSFDENYKFTTEQNKKDPSRKITVQSKGLFLHQTLGGEYAKKYLLNDTTLEKLSNSIKGEDKQPYKELLKVVKADMKTNPDSSKLTFFDAYSLYYLAQKYEVVDMLKYQQEQINKSSIKGIKLTKLKDDEVML